MEQILQHIEAILASIVTIVTILVGVLSKKQFSKHKKKEEVKQVRIGHTEAIEWNFKIYSIMQYLLHSLPASRISIVRSENGGGIPRPGCSLYATILFEVHDATLESIRNDFQRYPLDEGYQAILSNLLQKGFVDVRRKNSSSEIIRGLYEKNGIEQGWFYSLGFGENSYYYIVFANKEISSVTPSHKNDLEIAAVKIRKILSLRDTKESLSQHYENKEILEEDENAL